MSPGTSGLGAARANDCKEQGKRKCFDDLHVGFCLVLISTLVVILYVLRDAEAGSVEFGSILILHCFARLELVSA
jgi:hypothetical protein